MNLPGRYCAVDYGTRRIGLAISDPDGIIASPLATVEVRGGREAHVRAVIEAVRDEEVAAWVVGLPLNMDGSEGPQAELTWQFAERLQQVSLKPVHLFDERLSSFQADQLMAPANLSRKKSKARRDQVAAQVILQTFLDQRRQRLGP
jgi:putative Holliday junction resolvase